MDDPGFEPCQVQDIFLVSKISRTVPAPTQSPIPSLSEFFYCGLKRLGCKVAH